MTPDEVFGRIGKLPYMVREQGWIFYDLITANHLHTGLGLGVFQGASTAYIAGAIQDLGSGMFTTVNLLSAKDRTPNLEETLESVGLSHLVRIYYEPRSFNWRLMKILQEECYESFDFCCFDAAHTWYDTGLSICLVERLLKPGGWMVFDDLYFHQRESSNSEKPWVRRMPEEEQITRQVERVFRLLVETNPNFDTFRRQGRFAFARKRCAAWSHEQRTKNEEEIIISGALEKARCDPEFRDELLRSPSGALADLSGHPPEQFQHLRFADSEYFAPIPSKVNESGDTVVYLEKPSWDSRVSEAALQKMLDGISPEYDLSPRE